MLDIGGRTPDATENPILRFPTWLPPSILTALRVRYGEPARRYHVWRHVETMLEQYDAASGVIRDRDAFVLAVLFHDAVYDPTRQDNEVRSADLMERTMASLAPRAAVGGARALIMATRRHELPTDGPADPADAALLIDMDLSILGADGTEYDRYARHVREEYAHVPDEVFRPRRLGFLKQMSERGGIFLTEDFRARLESRALANMARESAALSAPPDHLPES